MAALFRAAAAPCQGVEAAEADLEAGTPVSEPSAPEPAQKPPRHAGSAEWSAASTEADAEGLDSRSGSGISLPSTLTDEDLLEDQEAAGNGNDDGCSDAKASVAAAQKPWLRRFSLAQAFRRRRNVALLLGMTMLVTCVVLFFPRYPTWTLAGLDLDVNAFVGEITGTQNTSEPLKVVAQVDVWNPNFVGAHLGTSTFFEIYYGNERMGRGATMPGEVRARTTSRVTVEVEVELTDGLAERLMQGAMADAFQLNVGAKVVVPVRAGFLNLKVAAQCHVVAAAMRLFQNPTDVLVDKQCTYRPVM